MCLCPCVVCEYVLLFECVRVCVRYAMWFVLGCVWCLPPSFFVSIFCFFSQEGFEVSPSSSDDGEDNDDGEDDDEEEEFGSVGATAAAATTTEAAAARSAMLEKMKQDYLEWKKHSWPPPTADNCFFLS